MKKMMEMIILLCLTLILMSCSNHELMNLDDTWVTEDLSFTITKFIDSDDQFFVLTYIQGDNGIYTFDLKDNRFRFFDRQRFGTPGNYTYQKTYLSDNDLYFMMSYQVKSDTIHLLYLNIITEPIVFRRLVVDE